MRMTYITFVLVNWRDNPWWNEEQEALRKNGTTTT